MDISNSPVVVFANPLALVSLLATLYLSTPPLLAPTRYIDGHLGEKPNSGRSLLLETAASQWQTKNIGCIWNCDSIRGSPGSKPRLAATAGTKHLSNTVLRTICNIRGGSDTASSVGAEWQATIGSSLRMTHTIHRSIRHSIERSINFLKHDYLIASNNQHPCCILVDRYLSQTLRA
jgi:hypothetical protein